MPTDDSRRKPVRRTARRRSTARQQAPTRRWRVRAQRARKAWRLVWSLRVPLAIAAVVLVAALAIASVNIDARFAAREREMPTRLYGRAAVLAPGALLPRGDVVAQLDRLGYRRTRKDPKEPGEMRVSDDLRVVLRPFDTAAGHAEATALRIQWDGTHIERVRNLDTGEQLASAVLPPELIATLYGPVQEDRAVLPLADYPSSLVDAVLVGEDRRFYHHHGIDPIGIARAAVTNASSGAIRQGGSTLTQQLAKNLFFDQERTLGRKAAEAIAALLLEARFSKQRILQAYLNEVYLGQRGAVSIKGFAQASWFYFGKRVQSLDLPESATLAALIPAPGLYNPFLHPERAKQRRDQLLEAMAKEGRISQEQCQQAQGEPMRVSRDPQASTELRAAPYLADCARQMIQQQTGGRTAEQLAHAGLRVYTTIDPALQHDAEGALSRGIGQLERTYRRLRRKDAQTRLQGAMVVLDPRDGSVLAMVGGRDYATSQFNRVTQARRPPGSLFKPFVYLAGYEAAAAAGFGADEPSEGLFTPATLLADEPLEMRVGGKMWAPANYDGEFRGPVAAQEALEQSLNVPTVRAALQIGLNAVVGVAEHCGLRSTLKPYPSLALGAQEVTPLEMARAYATIANGGVRNDASMVDAILDERGGKVYRHLAEPVQALTPPAAYLVTVALEGTLDRGTGSSARKLGFGGVGAGKTGTTDDYRDAWFCGYTPDLLALVWVGFDDGASMGLTGATAALPIWVDFMEHAGADADTHFVEPTGITWEEIDPVSGMRARWGCPDSREMAFLEGTAPTETCDQHSWHSKWW